MTVRGFILNTELHVWAKANDFVIDSSTEVRWSSVGDGSTAGGLVDGAVALGSSVGQEVLYFGCFRGELIQQIGEVGPRVQPVLFDTSADSHQYAGRVEAAVATVEEPFLRAHGEGTHGAFDDFVVDGEAEIP